MAHDHLGEAAQKDLADIVGYLNFSSGAPDARFLGGLNRLFATLEPAEPPLWKRAGGAILDAIDALHGSSEAFENLDQARDVAQLVFAEALPAYRRHHRDLLMHASDEFLFQPFFVGRMCEGVLAEGAPWEDTDRIVEGVLKRGERFRRPQAGGGIAEPSQAATLWA